VYASNSARVEEAFNDIAERVGLCSQLGVAVDIIPLVCKWLCNEANGRWLMIIDNVDDEITVESQKDGQSISLASLLPQSDHGAIIVTSRNADIARSLVGRQQDIIIIGTMSEGEAVELLQNKLGDKRRDGLLQLAKALDCIPLAIVQAAAYIDRLRPQMSVPKYLGQLKGSAEQVQLLQKAALDMRRDRKALNSVLATWQISFEYIRHKRPSAVYLLSFMSFFNQQSIPQFMIRHYTDKNGEGQDRSLDGRLREEEVDFKEDMAVLRAFSLVDTTQRDDEFEMHGLVQLATRVWLRSTNAERGWHWVFVQAMAQEFPNGEYVNWPRCQVLFPHVLPMVEQESLDIGKADKWTLLLNNAGWYAWRQGLFAQAEGMVSKALRKRREVLGADNSSTLLSSSLLGSILQDLGKYEEAESMHRQTLATSEKVLGVEHPNTLATMNNLARVLYSQGKYNEAESMHRQTLATSEKVLGVEHPNTLATMNNLARVLYSQGKYNEAESMHRQTLATSEKVLGVEHPDTLTTMNNLAGVLDSQGKYKEAESMHRQTLATREKVLGVEHPNTLATMNNLARVLDSQGKYNKAESMHRQTLATSEKVLGVEHPNTLATMNNLARVLYSQGKYKEAESMQRQTLATREKVLGVEHPDTLTTMNNLALVLYSQGKYNKAESMQRQTLATREKVLGVEHPDTLTTMNNLAGVLYSQGTHT
jgi:tetratricopeptide (TPR) repeat protein